MRNVCVWENCVCVRNVFVCVCMSAGDAFVLACMLGMCYVRMQVMSACILYGMVCMDSCLNVCNICICACMCLRMHSLLLLCVFPPSSIYYFDCMSSLADAKFGAN